MASIETRGETMTREEKLSRVAALPGLQPLEQRFSEYAVQQALKLQPLIERLPVVIEANGRVAGWLRYRMDRRGRVWHQRTGKAMGRRRRQRVGLQLGRWGGVHKWQVTP